MKNNTTSSSSTASNTTPHKSQDPAEPLDGASCSASFIEDGYLVEVNGVKYKLLDTREFTEYQVQGLRMFGIHPCDGESPYLAASYRNSGD